MNQPTATCTVVIPCYNGQEDLAAAVASVRGQSFEDYHLVLVDDASTDETLPLIRRLAEGDPRTTVVALGTNGGRSAARNRGTEATRGPYLAFLDQDDTYHPDFLRETAAILAGVPYLDRVKVLPNLSMELDPVRYKAVQNSLVTTSLFRREAFDFIGGWPESEIFRSHAHAGEDVALEELFRVCFNSAWLNKELYNYTRRPGNTFDQFLARSQVEGGQLGFTEATIEDDEVLLQEIARLKRSLHDRMQAVCRRHGHAAGLERLP